MDKAIKHPVADWVKPSFVIFGIWALWHSAHWVSECPDAKNYKWRLNPVWHSMLYSCTHGNSGRQRVNHFTQYRPNRCTGIWCMDYIYSVQVNLQISQYNIIQIPSPASSHVNPDINHQPSVVSLSYTAVNLCW